MITHYYTPCHRLAHYLQDDYPNGVVHYVDAYGDVVAYWRVEVLS
jgi:hypothetical protein